MNFYIAQYRQQMNFAYFQDDWKVTPKLTLNLGVRYEYATPQWESDNRLTNFDPVSNRLIPASSGSIADRAQVNPDRNNWAPRVGLAWTFRPSTVLRAGYGWFYAPGSGGVGSSPGDLGSGSSVGTSTFFGQPPAAPNTPVVGASLADPFVTGLLPYPNTLVGNGISAIFPE